MKPEWTIRAAIPDDSSGLKDCMESAYTQYQQRMGGVRLPPMDVDYLAEIKNYPTWVVEAQGKIVGGLIMIFENGNASIANIAVSSTCQGQGIGGQLIRFAESTAKQRGHTELQLATHRLLTENISLYQYLGWEETAIEGTRVLMMKKI